MKNPWFIPYLSDFSTTYRHTSGYMRVNNVLRKWFTWERLITTETCRDIECVYCDLNNIIEVEKVWLCDGIRETLKVNSLIDTISNRDNWFNHVTRMGHSCLPRYMMSYEPTRNRSLRPPKGRMGKSVLRSHNGQKPNAWRRRRGRRRSNEATVVI
jgi:hypothetical protein